MKTANPDPKQPDTWFSTGHRVLGAWSSILALSLVGVLGVRAQEAPVVPGAPPAPAAPVAPPPAPATPGPAEAPSPATPAPAAPATPAPTGEATPVAPAAPKKQVLNFENADLRVVLQALAKQAGMSLITPDDVRGTITARLVDVPIEKAMRVILESKGYSLIEMEGVYHVKSKESIAAEPTRTEVFQFTNAKAKEAKPTVDKLLTKAGNAQLDDRSNTLIITDVPSNLAKVVPIIKTLDAETKQVLIETKLMEMTRNPIESIGVNWRSLASYQVDLASSIQQSTGTGTSQISSGRLIGGITRSGDPGAIGAANAGRDGGILTTVGPAGYPFLAILDAPAFSTIFSFLLQDTDTELIGNPKVITQDNKEAKIRVATLEPIPNFTFNQQTASFVISGFDFRDVGNVLTVTPHVNKENFITLDVVPEVSTAQTGANGRTFALPGGSVSIPLISIRTLNSRVMVKDGHTLALGGLIEGTQNNAYTKVPFLGDIPVIGEIFRSRSLTKTRRNLLIFITPTVISSTTGTGLEDQYAGLKDMAPDDRFAYKRSFIGNAKPREQFEPADGQPAGEKLPKGMDQDQLAPRMAPSLRE